MGTRFYQRPENALKRAIELIEVGKPSRALDTLYDVIKRGKHRANYSEKTLEPIMYKYLDLCVDLKKSHNAKEGLFQYRNFCQSVNVASLENVVRYYLQKAEDKTDTARKESHLAVVDVDDLETVTAEQILLSTVSGEDRQDRSDRTILTPWVRFLWESYRQSLELLKTNSRVEKLYHDIAQQAFRFCMRYSRKTEFRKLCDNLRTHLAHVTKQQGQAASNINLNNPETQQMNLETRLVQLDNAIQMELWQEAYKAIEDIHGLVLSKKMHKPQIMANYFQKLSLVFWKAKNCLFHAAALFRLFQLSRDMKKNMSQEELTRMASKVLLASLAVPLPSAHPEFDRFIETEKNALEKTEKLATLLGLSKPPTRATIIKDLERYNVVQCVPKELQDLYHWLEVEYHPMQLCERVQTSLEFVTTFADSELLMQYIPAIQTFTLVRLIKQVSQVYDTIEFSRLLSLAPFTSPFELERIIVDSVRHNDMQIRVDHQKRCIHFGKDLSESQREDLPEGPTLQIMPSEQIRNQLISMSAVLQKMVDKLRPDRVKVGQEELRASIHRMYHQTKAKEHERILRRQHIIEQRKEMLENLSLEREEEERRRQEEQQRQQMEEEQRRLDREAAERERKRQEQEIKQIAARHLKDKIAQISQTPIGQKVIDKLDEEELLSLDPDEIMARQVEEIEKERRELQSKLNSQAKKVDYMERAKRLEEIPLLQKCHEEEQVKDREFWEMQEAARIQEIVEEHRVALKNNERLACMREDKEKFMDTLRSSRSSDYRSKLIEFEKKLTVERKKRLEERKQQRKLERRNKWILEKEEEEQRQRDEELKRKREEAERREMELKAAEEEAYRKKIEDLEAMEEKKKARLREIEEKAKEKEEREERERREEQERKRVEQEDWRRKPRAADREMEETGRDAPKCSWREREQAREASWRPSAERDDTRPSSGSWRRGPPARDDDRDEERLKGDMRRRAARPSDEPDGGESPWRRGPSRIGMSRDIRLDEPEEDRFRRPDREREDRFRRDRDFGRRNDDFRRGDDRRGDDFRRGDDRRGDDFRRGDDRRGDDFRRGDDRRGDDFRRGDDRRDDFKRGDDRRDDFRRGDDRRDDFRRGDRRGDDFRRGDDRRDDFRRNDEFRRGNERRDDFRRGDDRRGDDFKRGDDFRRGDDRRGDDFRRGDRGVDDRRDGPKRGGDTDGGSWRKPRRDEPPADISPSKANARQERKPVEVDADGWRTVRHN